ncbi:DUF308 domain-containing protein [Allosphingosinicella flava]|uniref:DUF308 domain-containing protein n=1 Tax=Allosphingosinicella flava TaxID=2771430 RepID=A0A7T2GM37_9SPHN|nr:DUF308 domain-containing protein [Sphingosinicella flava]QPQ56043.1 DUF308 domain-containing protein [Sphingosinicella flava]
MVLSTFEKEKTGTADHRSQRLVLLLCGLLILLCGAATIIVDAADPRDVVRKTGVLLLIAGGLEVIAGIAHRRFEQTEGRLDVILGIISLAVAAYFLLSPAYTAVRFAGLLTLWLLSRGGIDMLAAFLTGDLFSEEGRLLRASVDLVLGLVSYIGLGTTAWWESLMGWPTTASHVTFLFAGVSLAAAGLFLIGISRPRYAREEARGIDE